MVFFLFKIWDFNLQLKVHYNYNSTQLITIQLTIESTGGNTEINFGGGGGVAAVVRSTHRKQLGICIKYTYISEFMFWLHQAKFVNVK